MKDISLERFSWGRVPKLFGALCSLVIISLLLMVASSGKENIVQSQGAIIQIQPLKHPIIRPQEKLILDERPAHERKLKSYVPREKLSNVRAITKRKAGDQRIFGKRPFGPLSRYRQPNNPNLRWVAYFLEESLALVLQTSKNVMIECTVIELSKESEQRDALRTFGSLMPLAPLTLQDMINLMRLCGELPNNQLNYENATSFSSTKEVEKEMDRDRSSIILPGTLWCGIRDKAKRYEYLGEKKELDNCCRTHDHCPLKVLAFKGRYGVTNIGVGAKSHCLCEEEFYRCLKSVKIQAADMIGTFYFNVLRSDCLQGPIEEERENAPYHNSALSYHPQDYYKCEVVDEAQKCRFWSKLKTSNNYKLRPFHLKY